MVFGDPAIDSTTAMADLLLIAARSDELIAAVHAKCRDSQRLRRDFHDVMHGAMAAHLRAHLLADAWLAVRGRLFDTAPAEDRPPAPSESSLMRHNSEPSASAARQVMCRCRTPVCQGRPRNSGRH